MAPDGQSGDPDDEMTWWDRRRQRVIDQGLPIEEAVDGHPRQTDYEIDDEDVSQDPDDWPDGRRPADE